MDRRTFLGRLGALGAAGALGAIASACGSSSAAPVRAPQPARHRASKAAAVHEVDGLPVADWVVEENADPRRTRAWVIRHSRPAPDYFAPIEGFLDRVSAKKGDTITLFVSTTAPSFRAFIYRIGYYGGFGGRRVAASPELAGVQQPAPSFESGVNMVECRWRPSWATTVGADWPPGNYLIRLEPSRGPTEQRYVPFVVRDDESHATYLVQSSVTTWQAYNPYGGYSLYGGTPIGGADEYASRSRIVSFDRPYGHSATALDARGSGDFLGNEFPFIFLMERHGLDVSYWTDVDLAEQPGRLAQHHCLVSLGHDEYWSTPMRDAVTSAIASGTNVSFFGANACYRQIRLEASPTGRDRRVICYKDSSEDPITASDPALSTGGSWATDPIPRPESDLVGVMYQSYGADAPLVVADAGAWVFHGTGLAEGDEIPGVVGSEFDGFEPATPRPPGPVQLFSHSPTGAATVGGPGFSDSSYYAAPGQGGVFATGTAGWVSALWDGPLLTRRLLGFGVKRQAVAPLTRVTLNVLSEFAARRAGDRRPSVENWQRFYSAHTGTRQAVDVP